MSLSITKVLVVGSGSIAKRHIRNLRSCYPDAVVACVSSTGRPINPGEVGASVVYSDIQVAAVESPDFAIVASPANLHLQHVKLLIDHNIPVLVEKPLCMEVNEFEQSQWINHHALIRVAYNLRFMPAAQKMKRLIEEGIVGRVSTVFVEVGQYLPDWRPDQDYRTGVSAKRELGGGVLLELSHELDYLNWIFGEFDQVFGVIRNTHSLDIDVEDNVDAILQQEGGLIAHLHMDFLQHKPSRICKVIGEMGTLVWDLMDNEIIHSQPGGRTAVIFSDSTYDRNQMYVDQIEAFVQYVDGEATFASSPESAAAVLRLVEAIRQSDRSRQAVSVGRKH